MGFLIYFLDLSELHPWSSATDNGAYEIGRTGPYVSKDSSNGGSQENCMGGIIHDGRAVC